MKIAIGCDHAGYPLKHYLVSELSDNGFTVTDCGTYSEKSVDYPDYAGTVCKKIVSGEADLAILICGTGIGISIAANKVNGIRAALCHTEFSAVMARQHNNANVLALGANVIGKGLARSIARTFLKEPFSHGERHIRRIDKISGLEQ